MDDPSGAENKNALAAAYKAIFAGVHGQLVLEDLMDFCGMAKTNTNDIAPEPNQALFNDGKRRVGMRVASFLSMDPLDAFKATQGKGLT